MRTIGLATTLHPIHPACTRIIIASLTAVDGSILSVAAYYLLLIGSIFTFLAMILWVAQPGSRSCAQLPFSGIVKASLTFFFAAGSAVLGTLCLIVSAAIWTALIRKAQVLNNQARHVDPGDLARAPARLTPCRAQVTQSGQVPLGIHVEADTGLWLLWASAAAMFVSILPYLVR